MIIVKTSWKKYNISLEQVETKLKQRCNTNYNKNESSWK